MIFGLKMRIHDLVEDLSFVHTVKTRTLFIRIFEPGIVCIK